MNKFLLIAETNLKEFISIFIQLYNYFKPVEDTLPHIGGAKLLFLLKTLFISIVFERKTFVLANIGGNRTLSAPNCLPLFQTGIVFSSPITNKETKGKKKKAYLPEQLMKISFTLSISLSRTASAAASGYRSNLKNIRIAELRRAVSSGSGT